MDHTPPTYKIHCRKRRRRQSVHFCPSVTMRCIFSSCPPQDANVSSPSTWLAIDEVALLKKRARALAKKHREINSSTAQVTSQSANNSAKKSVRIGDVTRYEIEGESLRGMELCTNLSMRQKRLQIKDDTMLAVLFEQEEQYEAFWHHSDNSSFDPAEIKLRKWDTSRLAKAYQANAKGSLVYALRVADEDAKEAADILAEDLQDCS